ncbi:dihydrofolate reductase [Lactobacillus rizhaonensis]|uniref:dihydrofolate reductase n=1 Tax=Lactobacillus rizhaonensis TaxID=3082863 RepID=UPI0025D595BC|nr:dihydrofolate reductase [uncultured Lactobacillus sp.]
MITFVWAEDQKHQIGIDGHLPWKLPADLHHFKKITYGHPIIMGRKTFVSLPHLLPGRKHIVLTTSLTLKNKYRDNKQVSIINSVKELQDWINKNRQQNLCVIGGNSVFNALKNQVDCLEKTEIMASFKADVAMTKINYDDFTLVKKESHQPDSFNHYYYDFLTYLRKEK